MNARDQHYLGKYELVQRLGRGATAEVWKAFDPQLKRYVAIKILQAHLSIGPDALARFTREAQAIAALRHPNIVQIYDFQVSSEADHSMPYMVMDYIEGFTLAEYIRTNSRQSNFPSPLTIVNLFTSICSAVDYAHQHGMIHRDIKPANILLDKHNTTRNPMGEPILTDFGIVKLIGTAAGTQTNSSVGTPLYVSPEQAQGHPGNECSDIYSLGVILYEICTGIPPFRADSIYAIMMQHVYDQPIAPRLINPAIPSALEIVILRCLEKDPARRFPRATSLIAALAEAFNLPVPAEMPLPAYPQHSSEQPTYFKPQPPEQRSSEMAVLASPRSTPSASAASTPAHASLTPAGLSHPQARHSTSSDAHQTIQQGSAAMAMKQPGSASALALFARVPAFLRSLPAGRVARRNPLLIALFTFLLIGIVVGSLITTLQTSRSAPITGSAIVGQAFFQDGSGPSVQSGQATNTALQLQLHGIPAPHAGNDYYVWLQPDKDAHEALARLIGTLHVSQRGDTTLSTPYSDPQASNLLASFGGLLITEESATPTPQAPSPDTRTWRYSAQLPQKVGSDGFSGLTHLRHLLVGESDLTQLHITGGLAYWFRQNINEIFKWSIEEVDHNQLADRRGKIVNMLYFLHGQCAQQDLSNAAWKAADNDAIASTQVPLLECSQISLPGYLRHIIKHLNGVLSEPGATAHQKALATQIILALNYEEQELNTLLNDAQQLAVKDDAQFQDPASLPLFNDIQQQARYAAEGWYDPNTNTVHPGANAIYGLLQNLATFDITPVR